MSDREWPSGILAILMDNMSEAVALLDAEGRVLASNAALARLSGSSPEEWHDDLVTRFYSASGDPERIQEVLARALEEGIAEGEAHGDRQDGSPLWLRYRLVRLPEEDGRPGVQAFRRSGVWDAPLASDIISSSLPLRRSRHPSPFGGAVTSSPVLLAVAEDITRDVERRSAQELSRRLLEEAARREETLTRLNRELAALNALAATVNQSLDLESVLEAALDCALEVAETSTGWVCLLPTQESLELELVAHRGLPEEYVLRYGRLRIGDCMAGKAVVTGKPLVLYSLPPEEAVTAYLRQQQIRCVAHIPLRNRDRAIGVMGIGSAHFEQLSEGLVRFLNSVGHQVGLAIQNARLYEQVKQRADIDPLTGLYNRQRFCELLEDRLVGARSAAFGVGEADRDTQHPTPNSPTGPWVLMIDIDNFKQINDASGHVRGDQVLREVAQLLRRSVRGRDFVGRYGGDEFVVALCDNEEAPPGARAAAARAVVRCLRRRFERASLAGEFCIPLTVSIGTACTGADSEHCLQRADVAMYRVKRRRKRRKAVASSQ